MKNNLKNVAFATMVGMCTFQIGVVWNENNIKKGTPKTVSK